VTSRVVVDLNERRANLEELKKELTQNHIMRLAYAIMRLPWVVFLAITGGVTAYPDGAKRVLAFSPIIVPNQGFHTWPGVPFSHKE
jgi:hypothetical protein